MSDPRMILNFEAVVSFAGNDEDGLAKYEIQLMVNHHVVKRWPIDAGVMYLIETRGKAYLESEVASRLFCLLNVPKDITP